MSNMFDMGMFGMLHPDERKRILQGGSLFQKPSISDRQPGFETQNRGSLQTAGGVNLIDREHRKRGEIPTPQKYQRDVPIQRDRLGRIINQDKFSKVPSSDFQTRFRGGDKIEKAQALAASSAAKTPVVNTEYQDAIRRGGKGANVPNDLNWWQKLSGMFNSKFDLEGAKASWTKKGGFEGLMANPAFTMGLAFMQSAAEGKSLGSGALDNVMKAGGISHTYKKIIEDRKQEPIQATAQDIGEVKTLLKSMNIEEGNWLENLLGGPESGMKYDAAVEEIAIQFQKEVSDWQKNNKNPDGTPKIIRSTDKIKILNRLVKSGKIIKKENWLNRIGITSGTLQMPLPKEQGGPVAKGQSYVVGEGGPEYFLPQESGKILSNDDSQIYAMLLASNPQLQKVSRARAERILRTRFPEYFE